MRLLLIAVGLWLAGLALSAPKAEAQASAPFCVVSRAGTSCFYYDAHACREAAERERGACVVNQSSQGGAGGGQVQPDVWGAFRRGAEAGRAAEREPPVIQSNPAQSNLGPILLQFCREMTAQDVAELDRMLPLEGDEEIENYTRLLDMYHARTQRCYAIVDSQR
jgi:hypothetical protein